MKGFIYRPARLIALASLLGATLATASAPVMQAGAAAPLAAGILCTTSLPDFPGSGSASCNGSATGIANGSAAVLTGFSANFNYSEPCPPVLGSASGTYSAGSASGSFTWTRVGLTAILTLHPNGGTIGAAAALFAPLGTNAGMFTSGCPGHGPVTATVVALGAGA